MSDKEQKKQKIKWSYLDIHKRVYKTIFGKGIKPYVVMILVFFAFSFAGIINSAASGEIAYIDSRYGAGAVNTEDVNAVMDYSMTLPGIRDLPDNVKEDVVKPEIFNIIISHSWLLNLLAMNHEYVVRNMGEVFAFLVIVMALVEFTSFFIKKTLAIGQYRFMMENRFQKNVKIRRIFAPFRNKNLLHIIKVMFIYDLVSTLWWFTIIGGIYKSFQYYFVPYLLAEDPTIGWLKARKISMQMTRGYKFKMFLTQLTFFYTSFISAIPFADLLVCTPLNTFTDIEMYYLLRERTDIDRSAFVENVFDGDAYVDISKEYRTDETPSYVLGDYVIKGSGFDKADKYKLTDFVVMFFVFCFVGWLWEVAYHIVSDHEFVNRGFMYGPWLPIYGVGGAGIIFILGRYKKNKLKLFILTMLLCGIMEYLTSFVLEFFTNKAYWTYFDMSFNLNGRVCLAGLLAFAIGGFFGIYILGPLIKRKLEKLGKKRTKILCIVLTSIFAIDLICCLTIGPNQGKGVGGDYDTVATRVAIEESSQ